MNSLSDISFDAVLSEIFTPSPKLDPIYAPRRKPAQPGPKPVPKTIPKPDPFSPEADTLYARLYRARATLAENKGMPPYVICSDATLHDLMAKLPKTLQELDSVNGLSPAKIRSYGKILLQVIQEWLAGHPEKEDSWDNVSFTEEERQQILRRLQGRESVHGIAISLDRPEADVAQACRLLMRDPAVSAPEKKRASQADPVPAPFHRQARPGPGAGRQSAPDRTWTERETNWLNLLRSQGKDAQAIATQMGRSTEEIEAMIRKTGKNTL